MKAKKLTLTDLKRVDKEAYLKQNKTNIHVVLENIRSGMNVGSFFRTSDGLAIEKISLVGITPTPPHKEILKTAIGASSIVEWEYFENIQAALKQSIEESVIISIEQTDRSFSLENLADIGLDQSRKIILIFGNEVQGVSEEAIRLSDYCCEIPQFGTKHSFNVAVCGGMILWEFSKYLGFNKH